MLAGVYQTHNINTNESCANCLAQMNQLVSWNPTTIAAVMFYNNSGNLRFKAFYIVGRTGSR